MRKLVLLLGLLGVAGCNVPPEHPPVCVSNLGTKSIWWKQRYPQSRDPETQWQLLTEGKTVCADPGYTLSLSAD